jgi:linoleoyl-CoA desaturase
MDIQDKVILRFSPYTNVKWYHKLQIFYALFFYGITTLYRALLKDFLHYRTYKKNGLNTNTDQEKGWFVFKLILDNVIYFAFFLLLPILVFQLTVLEVLSGFLLMHLVTASCLN